jgi:hypothetical protein
MLSLPELMNRHKMIVLFHNFLHVLSPYGKFIGILRYENGDILSNTSALCVDSEDNIWAGRHIERTMQLRNFRRKLNIRKME